MPFGFFKKNKKEEEPHYDPTNIKVTDIRKGFVLDYDLKTWEVQDEYEYDWGDNNFSYEFKLVSADDVVFLSVEEDDFVECTVTRKLNFNKLDEEIEEAILSKGKPPRQIIYNGTVFYRDGEHAGYFRNIKDTSFQPFVSWEYYDDSEKQVLVIEQWGDEDFEASIGKVESESDFSNILPIEM
ncbi:DUF4178 domain-containing protein [Limibacter armeniacum]|uniref:DUF4178 domain-containing protein n=1 Tax=Limibacter armeniacum TaxID=466084 RepID=UPI002FE5FAE2